MKGCYIYCTDDKLAEHFRERLKAYAKGMKLVLENTNADNSDNNE